MKAAQLTWCLVLVTLSTCYNVTEINNNNNNNNVSDLISEYSDNSEMTGSDYSLIMGPEDNMTELTGGDMEEEIEEEEDFAPIDTGRRKGEEPFLCIVTCPSIFYSNSH